MTLAYKIERKVFGGRFSKLHTVPDGMTVADQQAIIDRLSDHMDTHQMWDHWASDAWRQAHPDYDTHKRPTVRRVRSNTKWSGSWAYGKDRVISMSSFHGPAMVCHEFAHIVTPEDRGHGDAWRDAYVVCVEVILGGYQSTRLKNAFAREYRAGQDRAVAKRSRGRR